jgi:hypothetical protein
MDYGQGSTQTLGSVSSQVAVNLNHGLAQIDRTHTVKLNWMWEVPKIRWNWKPGSAAINGCQLSGIASFVSGAPTGVGYSTTYAVDVTGSPTDGARVVVLSNPVLPKGDRTFSQNFRTDVFRMPAVGTIGNANRTILRLPGTNNWDMVLAKTFPIKERVRMQLRCELYNAFNHTQFSSFDTGARFDPQGNQVNGNFGAYTATSNPRKMQLTARINF